MSSTNFTIEFTPRAVRDLKRLDPRIRLQLLQASTVLRQQPYPDVGRRIKLLVGVIPRHFRLRVGDYRLIYRVEGNLVIIARVAHRREAYR
jgi:mRNA interferase RelE/StbE